MLSQPVSITDRPYKTIRYQGVHVWNRILLLDIDVSLGIATFKYYVKKAILQGDLPSEASLKRAANAR